MKRLVTLLAVLLTISVMSPIWCRADAPVVNPDTPTWLLNLCTTIHCLDNLTGKFGYDVREGEMTEGGFTELYTVNKAFGLGAGIEKPTGADNRYNIDGDIIVHPGPMLADAFKTVADILAYPPFTSGLLQYATIGYNAYWDFRAKEIRHGPWVGLQATFSTTGYTAPRSQSAKLTAPESRGFGL